MDQCEFLMQFSYNVVGFHTTSQCSKNEENRKNEKNMRVVATCKTKTKKQKKNGELLLSLQIIIISTS